MEKELKLEDISDDFEPRHKEVMLDIVLAWGALDGALGMLLSRVKGYSMADGADKIGKMPGSAKLGEIRRILKNYPGAEGAAKIVRKHKKTYERYSVPRNRVCHSKCVGIWTVNPDYIVFAVYEKEGEEGLAIERIPIQEMQRATRWGREFQNVLLRMIDATE